MDIEKLARKLEPLIPEQVEHWLRVRDIADADVKNLIEKEMAGVAHELLGDFRKKILLSLPPKKKAKGSIHLGTIIYEADKWEFGISRAELLRNMGICGMSGSGKTNVAFHILEQLVEKKIPFLFWDWKRTARHLIPTIGGRVNIYTPGRKLSPFPFNPFIVPPGLEPSVYVNQVVDVMADAYTLGDGSRSLLQKAIAACYRAGNRTPTVTHILAEVGKFPAKGRVGGWKISATRALESLEFSDITATDSSEQNIFANSLLGKNTIVELDALAQGAKKFLIPMMCLWLYYVQLASPAREKLKLVIFVEEAHHVLYRQEQRAKESVMNMLLRQCREIGIGIIVIDQHPHLISSAALGNTYTTICLNQRDPSDINRAAGLSLVDDSEKRFFSMLPVGQAIVKLQDRWRRPFLIYAPLVKVRKGLVSDDLLAKFLKGSLTASGLRSVVNRAFGRDVHDLAHDKVLDQDAFAFLEDVLEHQDDGVRTRYKRLGFSVDKGNRLKNRLVEDGILEEQEVKVGRTRKILLRVTHGARARLGLKKNLGRGSIVHEYWKRFYAAHFKGEGYHVELEAPRRNGRVDMLATKGAESIAVEIETGKSDVVWNVKQNLMSRFNSVLVVATDESALDKVELQLAKAGLIIPNRIRVVLRDGGLAA
ncbi:MAG: hypothetical protein J3T61_08410 [Candidatus Brocadiales bacterium]|nr:hypothetical protein [Candidatus Bathyanammoxibius sp.]